MTTFHEGQEVEVFTWLPHGEWCKARIVEGRPALCHEVQFPDGTRAVFDDRDIKAIKTSTMTADDNGRIVRGY